MTDPRIRRRGWKYWSTQNCDRCSHPGAYHNDEGGSFMTCDYPVHNGFDKWCGCPSFLWSKWDE